MNNLLIKSSLFLSLMTVSLPFSLTVRSEPLQATRCSNGSARMMTEGDANFRKGSLLCPQDFVLPVQGKQHRIFCRNTGKVLAGRTGRVGELCVGKLQIDQICENPEEEGCFGVTRGNEDDLKLIKPFGSTIIQKRPDLIWNPTEGASHYEIRIDGYQLKLEQTASENHLKYPSNWPALEYGSVYDINIFAYRQGKIISADRATVNLVFEKDAVAIQENAAALKSLPLPPNEVALELDTLYMTRNLFSQTIQLLESLREKGQSNPQLDQLLAKRYSQAGHPDLAKAILGTAQLPTKTKLLQ